MTDKAEAKLKFAIDTMQQPLQAATDAAHDLKPADDDEAEFARDMEIAGLVNRLVFLCGPNLRVLNEIINVLLEHEDPEHDVPIVERRPS